MNKFRHLNPLTDEHHSHREETLFDAAVVALVGVVIYGFFQEPINKMIMAILLALGLVGCAAGSGSDVSLRHGETYRDRVAVVATSEAVRSPIERKLKSEFDFSFVPYTLSHFAVVVTDSYEEGIVALRVRIRFAGSEIHHLDIEETIGEVDSVAAETLVALLANDPSTLDSIVELVRDALVVADAKNKKYEQRIVENR